MSKQTKSILSGQSLRYWRMAQIVVGLIGLGVFFALIFIPNIGIHAFWNVLIPIAPALLVMVTGLWRNVCPLASTSLIPRHLGFSKRKRLRRKQQGKLQLIAVILLLLIIPLRHTIFNTNAQATAFVLGFLAFLAFYLGSIYDWKSVWCSGLCPVHPVEKLYGRKNALSLPNAHCKTCINCVIPCPDATSSLLTKKKKESYQKIAENLMIGGFPGFIWGWFHVQDYVNNEGWKHLVLTYAYPLLAMLITLFAFLVAKKYIAIKSEILLIDTFATASISLYYWYRLPALIGFGLFQDDGRLVNLSQTLPFWFPYILQISTTLFFIWWIVFKKNDMTPWLIRPPYQKKTKTIQLFSHIRTNNYK